jgi:hypothetical protein
MCSVISFVNGKCEGSVTMTFVIYYSETRQQPHTNHFVCHLSSDVTTTSTINTIITTKKHNDCQILGSRLNFFYPYQTYPPWGTQQCSVIPGDGFLLTCPVISILVNYHTLFSPQTPLDTTKGAVTNECPMFKVTTGMTTGPLATAWAQTCWYGWALGLHSTLHSITCGRRLATNWITVPMGQQGKIRQRVTSERQ